jgi:nicotinamidase-related amidase
MPDPEHIDPRRTALIAYDVCQRTLVPPDPARSAAMRPVLDAWVEMIATARAAGVPVIYTTPVSRADGADLVMLPTDLSAETGVPPLTNAVEGSSDAGFPAEIVPRTPFFSNAGRAPSTAQGLPNCCTCCGATPSSLAAAPPIAASRPAFARPSIST